MSLADRAAGFLTEPVLRRPGPYRMIGKLLARSGAQARLINDYIEPREGHRILDLGCGPADLLAALPAVRYVGIDINPAYIDAAAARFGARGEFLSGSFRRARDMPGSFDRVLALGFLHHLDDADGAELVEIAEEQLAPGGLLVTVDCVIRAGQPRFARWLIDRDRGDHARTRADYLALIDPVFRHVEAIELDDLLRVPYSHIVIRARKT